MLLENLLYAIQGVIFFLIFGGFEFKYLFKWQIWLVAIISMFHHVCKILGIKKSKHVSAQVITDFIKIVFVFFICYWFFDIMPTRNEVVGTIIIISSLFIIKRK